MGEIMTVGEPMAMFVADQVGPLETIDHFTKLLAGAEINVSIGLKRLDHHVRYMTKLGQDPFGQYIYNFLEKEHILTSNVSFDSRFPTGFQLKSKVETGDPEVVYFRKGSAASYLSKEDIQKVDLDQVEHIHLTGIPLALSKSCREAIHVLILLAKEKNIPISFDPNLRPSLWNSEEEMVYEINRVACQCDIVLPGLEEGRTLTGYQNETTICDYYLKQGVNQVVVKLGSKGSYGKSRAKEVHVAGYPVEQIVDTVGAGDGFAVGVIDGLIQGKSLEDAMIQGNIIGALQVQTPGDNDGLPFRSKLDTYRQKWVGA